MAIAEHRAGSLDLTRDDDLEGTGRGHRHADVGEPEHGPGPLGDLTVGFEEREPAHRMAPERRDVDGPSGSTITCMRRDVETAGDLHLEHVPVAEPIVGSRRCFGSNPERAPPRWVAPRVGLGSDAEDGVAVDDWVVELAAGCASASEARACKRIARKLKARENTLLRGSGRLRRNGALSLFTTKGSRKKADF